MVTKIGKPENECLALFKQRPLPAEVKEALTKFFKINSNLMAALRSHELIKLTGGNPLSIKMLASYLKNQDGGRCTLK